MATLKRRRGSIIFDRGREQNYSSKLAKMRQYVVLILAWALQPERDVSTFLQSSAVSGSMRLCDRGSLELVQR
jgi:hypothetical protein